MSKIRNLFLVSAAAVTLAVAATAGAYAAQIVKYHEMNVRAPDGAVVHVRYAGDTPPQIRFETPAGVIDIPAPVALRGTFPTVPLAEMERISAALDRQAAALFHAVHAPDIFASRYDGAGSVGPSGALNVDLGPLPPGVQGYSRLFGIVRWQNLHAAHELRL